LDLAAGDRLDSTKSHPITYGVAQLEEFVKRHGWSSQQVLAVDAHYTAEPFLSPVHDLAFRSWGEWPAIAFSSCHRRLIRVLDVRGVRGRKIKLNDARTLPKIDAQDEWELEGGSRIEVSCWNDVRMRRWLPQSLTLYRVIEYKADGNPRYKRPWWLIFVPAWSEAELPRPREAQAISEERFRVEHSIRLLNGDLGLTCGQFNSAEAEGRVQVSRRDGADRFLVLVGLARVGRARTRKSSGLVAQGQVDAGSHPKTGGRTFVECWMEQASTQTSRKVAGASRRNEA